MQSDKGLPKIDSRGKQNKSNFKINFQEVALARLPIFVWLQQTNFSRQLVIDQYESIFLGMDDVEVTSLFFCF